MLPLNFFRRKADLVFGKILILGFALLTLLIFLSANIYSQLFLIERSIRGKLEAICGCANHFSFTSHPFIFTFLFFSSLIFGLWLCSTVFKILKTFIVTKKFINFNLKKQKNNLSTEVREIISKIGLTSKLIEIQEEKQIIFCFGFLKPKICISSGLIKQLNKAELRAVLLHEQRHLLAYEPLRLWLVKLTSKMFFFVPGFKLLAKQYFILSELSADEQATNGFRKKIHLARALDKIMQNQEKLIIQNNLAIPFFSMITEERVCKLTNNDYVPKIQTFLPIFLVILFILFSFFSFERLSNSSEAAILNHDCELMDTKSEDECLMSSPEVSCKASYLPGESSCGNIYF